MTTTKTSLTLLFIATLLQCQFAFSTITPSNPQSDTAITTNILATINHYRITHRLPLLQTSTIIAAEAKKHSMDMANHRLSFGHQGFPKRIKRICRRIKGCNGGAENVAFNYKPNVVTKGWLASPGHKRNIDGHYNLTGIGIARDKNGKIYYTQIFIRATQRLSNPIISH